MFTASRIYSSILAPDVLQEELTQTFTAFESNSVEIEDEQRPFHAQYEMGRWYLHPRDSNKGEEKFTIRGQIRKKENGGSLFLFEAKASRTQKWSLFKDSLYGLFLCLFTACMEVMQDMPLSLIIASIPVMLVFVGVYLKKSHQKILNYRWSQLDKNLEELAQVI